MTTFPTASRARPPGAPAVWAAPGPGVNAGRRQRGRTWTGDDRSRSRLESRGYCRSRGRQSCPLPPRLGERPARATAASARPPRTRRPTRPAATNPCQPRSPGPGEPSSSARDRATEPRSPSRALRCAPRRPLRNRRPLSSDLVRLGSAPIGRTGAERADVVLGVPAMCPIGWWRGRPGGHSGTAWQWR